MVNEYGIGMVVCKLKLLERKKVWINPNERVRLSIWRILKTNTTLKVSV